MKVKTIIKVLRNSDYCIMASSGWQKAAGFVNANGFDSGDSYLVEDEEIAEIKAGACNGDSTLYIKLK